MHGCLFQRFVFLSNIDRFPCGFCHRRIYIRQTGAVVKGNRADLCEISQYGYLFQTGAAGKCIVKDPCHASRNLQFLQCGAVAESAFFDLGQIRRKIELFQTLTVPECAPADAFHAFGNNYFRYRCTVERIRSDLLHAVGNHDSAVRTRSGIHQNMVHLHQRIFRLALFQPCRAAQRIYADVLYRFRNVQLCQRTAKAKTAVRNGAQRFWQRHILQLGAAPKHIFSQSLYGVGNCHTGQTFTGLKGTLSDFRHRFSLDLRRNHDFFRIFVTLRNHSPVRF